MANPSPVTYPSKSLPGGVMAYAPAKINRFLHITGRRSDGYHNIETGFQFLNWCDRIHFRRTKRRGIYLIDDPMKLGSENLIYQAATKLMSGQTLGVEILIEKFLPAGGGLGGGSSDAATTLVVLNELLRLGLNDEDLKKHGLSIGADVPVFIHGKSCFASGIGNLCDPELWPENHILIANPGIHISTQAIFQHSKLTRDTPSCRIRRSQLHTTRNDCEVLVRKLYPEIDHLMDLMQAFGEPKLTGTGGCAFIVEPELKDQSKLKQIKGLALVKEALLTNQSMLYTYGVNE
ncbi:4-(cytidine 5'-diphospho)-2-C-methyl-D-erythritol kinase [Litorivicinus sp.]|nr:4-(cytidine 5'-diphospho)-2-C-methyl-D-erythritol kinase [Litorivicinus sp.]